MAILSGTPSLPGLTHFMNWPPSCSIFSLIHFSISRSLCIGFLLFTSTEKQGPTFSIYVYMRSRGGVFRVCYRNIIIVYRLTCSTCCHPLESLIFQWFQVCTTTCTTTSTSATCYRLTSSRGCSQLSRCHPLLPTCCRPLLLHIRAGVRSLRSLLLCRFFPIQGSLPSWPRSRSRPASSMKTSVFRSTRRRSPSR